MDQWCWRVILEEGVPLDELDGREGSWREGDDAEVKIR